MVEKEECRKCAYCCIKCIFLEFDYSLNLFFCLIYKNKDRYPVRYDREDYIIEFNILRNLFPNHPKYKIHLEGYYGIDKKVCDTYGENCNIYKNSYNFKHSKESYETYLEDVEKVRLSIGNFNGLVEVLNAQV